MSLTKADIIEAVRETLRLSRDQSAEAIECLLEIIKRTLADGDDVLVTNFGKFIVQSKAARMGRNPNTNERMRLPARRRVTFKWSGKLRDRINACG